MAMERDMDKAPPWKIKCSCFGVWNAFIMYSLAKTCLFASMHPEGWVWLYGLIFVFIFTLIHVELVASREGSAKQNISQFPECVHRFWPLAIQAKASPSTLAELLTTISQTL